MLIAICSAIAFLLMISAIFLCFARAFKGPDLANRVVALDLTANILISLIAVFCIYRNQAIYLDIIIAMALIIFLTTVAFANFIGNEARKHKEH